MRALVRRTGDLGALRAAIHRDTDHVDADTTGEFVLAVHEVVSSLVVDDLSGVGHAVDVRWSEREHPRAELFAEVRTVIEDPRGLSGAGLQAAVLHGSADQVVIDRRIGGSVVVVRRRV